MKKLGLQKLGSNCLQKKLHDWLLSNICVYPGAGILFIILANSRRLSLSNIIYSTKLMTMIAADYGSRCQRIVNRQSNGTAIFLGNYRQAL